MKEKINIEKVIKYWIESSEQNFETAEFLFKGKRYSDSLFFCHLMIEKILKALVVKETKTHAPYIHELDTLAQKAVLKLSREQMKQLEIINTFNIRTRYDIAKQQFYKQCTKNYTTKYFDIAKELYLWLQKQFPKK